MDSKQWQKVQTLFEHALQLSGSQRQQFLDKLKIENEPLFREVNSLLKEDAQAIPFLDEENISNRILKNKNPFMDPDKIGKQFGPYQITEFLAQGGMGSVYKAQRNDGNFEQVVALKIIHQFLKSPTVSERFRRERQILAGLNHPNIAGLIDGGITTNGVPFLVMEFVEGNNLSEYVERNNLIVNQRLKLFMKICDAVSYAHRHLVIHRDLKPGNVFVTTDGQVKLLDFGVAKVLDNSQPSINQSNLTGEGLVPFTPEYAAPEHLSGGDISTSSDVYSLGIILYELLSDVRPYKFETQNLVEIQKTVQLHVPQKPSQALIQSNPNARFRARQVNGDLDNICLKALKKEPALRYSTSEQMRQDIYNHLNGIPVSATNDNISYRIRKFIKRHQPAVAVAAILFIILLSTIGIYTRQLKIENERARIETRKAVQTAAFLQSLFESANPDVSRGEDLSAQELLDRGVQRIETELINEPEIQAQMFSTMGEVYRRLANFETADNLFNKALERRQTHLGDGHPSISENLLALARLNTDRGSFDLAEKHAQSALEKRLARNSTNLEISEACEALASVYYEQRIYHEADSLYKEALKFYLRDSEEDDYTAAITASIASIARRQEKYEEAEVLYLKSLKLRRTILGDDHSDVAHTLNHLGRLYYQQKRFNEAEPLVREALALRQKIFGQIHPETGASLGTLAGILKATKRFKEAEDYYRQVLHIVKTLYGKEHPYHVGTNTNLAYTLLEQVKFEQAETYFRDALEASQFSMAEDNLRRTDVQFGLGLVLTKLKRTDEAVLYLEKAFKLRVDKLGPKDPKSIETSLALVECCLELHDLTQAENYLKHAAKHINKKDAKESLLQRLAQFQNDYKQLSGQDLIVHN